MKGKCNQCGCTENNACYHPDFGNCWWVNDDQDLCSHCVELKDHPGVERPSDRDAFELKDEKSESVKSKILKGHPFKIIILSVEEILKIDNDSIYDLRQNSRLIAMVDKTTKTGFHWRKWILNCRAKGFIKFKNCELIDINS